MEALGADADGQVAEKFVGQMCVDAIPCGILNASGKIDIAGQRYTSSRVR